MTQLEGETTVKPYLIRKLSKESDARIEGRKVVQGLVELTTEWNIAKQEQRQLVFKKVAPKEGERTCGYRC